MAMTQSERSQKYFEKYGIKQKKFNLEPETLALFEALAETTGKSQTQILKEAVREYAAKHGLA